MFTHWRNFVASGAWWQLAHNPMKANQAEEALRYSRAQRRER